MTDKSEFAEAAARAKEERALVKAEQTSVATQIPQTLTLDWRQSPIDALVSVLVRVPFKGSGGEPDYYLQPWQAFMFATQCFENEVSPFSNEAWFNPKNNKVNFTLQGKLKIARKQGWQIGAPTFERTPADHTKPLVSYKCKLPVWSHNEKQILEYTALLSEWKMGSPIWREKPDHMLQTRAYEKALSWVGVGASELPDDRDIDAAAETPIIPSTPVDFTPAPEPASLSTINPKEE